MKTEFDILIVGAGLVGLTTALACAASGAQVGLLDRMSVAAGRDSRASALSSTSLRLFQNLGVDISEHLQPIHDMLVTEGVPNSPWRLHFDGEETDADLGSLIENPALKAALIKQVSETGSVTVLAPIAVQDFTEDVSNIRLHTDQGDLTAKLLIAADGRTTCLT